VCHVRPCNLVVTSMSLHTVAPCLTKLHGVTCCKTVIFTVTVLYFITLLTYLLTPWSRALLEKLFCN